MHRGSCLCGAIAYEIEGPIESIVYCHCSMCRKWHGTAFRTRAAVRRDRFRFLRGEELLTRYRSSADTVKTFCRICGSPMVNSWDPEPENYGLALGTLETVPEGRPARHIFVGSKAPWFEITDGLPQHDEFPPRR
jgi:hypothetical protein